MTELLRRLVRWRASRADDTMAPMDEDREHAKELWTASQLADWLGVSRQAVNLRVSRGTLRPHYWARMGDRTYYMFDPARVKHWRKTRA
jgi:hypothetical protein